ncbi:NAD(P)-binding protein [Plenodomus tracheiphilus IPT5]|uniref:NAD(P)-binding protein n=1 Tax=Plenodomus tracheiphilus IPT5 TaxID=1408161 RepID=A0A6A7ALX7_9PLEO|nr:NAD(P)-binding protein [Plenodomus tracheiphilus IPT5]
MSAFLRGKVALVTGASSGIGRACAKALAAQGASVVCTDLRPEPNPKGYEPDLHHTTVEAIQHAGGRANFDKLDIASRQDADRVFLNLLNTHGKLDVVVSAAGLLLPLRKFADEDDELWDTMSQINLLGTARINRLAVRQFLKQDLDPVWGSRGRIVNISSGAGSYTMSREVGYSATKAGVNQLTRAAAMDHAVDGININCIAPGFIATGMARDIMHDPAIVAALKQGTPWRRLGEADDVANAAAFLVSPAATFITGHVLNVDGGATLGQAPPKDT